MGVGNASPAYGIGIQTCDSSSVNCSVPDGISRGIAVSGNTVEDARTGWGIAIETLINLSANNSTITGNTLISNKGGIATVGAQAVSGLTIVGNSISRPAASGGNQGIYLEQVSDSTVSANTISNAGQQGIVLYTGSKRNVVSGNIVRDCGQNGAGLDGIYVIGTGTSNNVIMGNNLFNANGATQRYGIFEAGGDIYPTTF